VCSASSHLARFHVVVESAPGLAEEVVRVREPVVAHATGSEEHIIPVASGEGGGGGAETRAVSTRGGGQTGGKWRTHLTMERFERRNQRAIAGTTTEYATNVSTAMGRSVF
jgi:hypothetical protein